MGRSRSWGAGTAIFAGIALVLVLCRPSSTPAGPTPRALSVPLHPSAAAVVQIRIYTINRGKLSDFVHAWQAGVYPLRLKMGYQIPAAWTIEETNQFVWIVTYDGPEQWQEKEAAYYASAGRAALSPDPAQWIAKAEQWFVRPALPAR